MLAIISICSCWPAKTQYTCSIIIHNNYNNLPTMTCALNGNYLITSHSVDHLCYFLTIMLHYNYDPYLIGLLRLSRMGINDINN